MNFGEFSEENYANKKVIDIILSYFFFAQQSDVLWHFFTQLWHLPLKRLNQFSSFVPEVNYSVAKFDTILVYSFEELGIGVPFTYCIK